MMLKATLDAPGAEKTCKARLLPQIFKLSCVQGIMNHLIHWQCFNMTEPCLQLVWHMLCRYQGFLMAEHVNHGELAKQCAYVSAALFMAAWVTLTSMLGLNCLN